MTARRDSLVSAVLGTTFADVARDVNRGGWILRPREGTPTQLKAMQRALKLFEGCNAGPLRNRWEPNDRTQRALKQFQSTFFPGWQGTGDPNLENMTPIDHGLFDWPTLYILDFKAQERERRATAPERPVSFDRRNTFSFVPQGLELELHIESWDPALLGPPEARSQASMRESIALVLTEFDEHVDEDLGWFDCVVEEREGGHYLRPDPRYHPPPTPADDTHHSLLLKLPLGPSRWFPFRVPIRGESVSDPNSHEGPNYEIDFSFKMGSDGKLLSPLPSRMARPPGYAPPAGDRPYEERKIANVQADGGVEGPVVPAAVDQSHVGPTPGRDTGDWESFAPGGGGANAGAALSDDLVRQITDWRASMPRFRLARKNAGHQYMSEDQPAHRTWVDGSLTTLISAAQGAEARLLGSFKVHQRREGWTNAINSYDNQIVTWGTGFGGKGLLGAVMKRVAAASADAIRVFHNCGFRHVGPVNDNVFDCVDLATRTVVRGKAPALKLVQQSTELLCMLIEVASAEATRQAVFDAMLETFRGNTNFAGASQIFTQAVFNFAVHLHHWLPAYAQPNMVGWAVDQVRAAHGEQPSIERDLAMAPEMSRYFFARAIRVREAARAAHPHNVPPAPPWDRHVANHYGQLNADLAAEGIRTRVSPPAEEPTAVIDGV
jgi:hypothetical protein